tara:strand:- start:82544 stop:83728 length:1185 start_codon:yes stop_codon:yes gene_type:complete
VSEASSISNLSENGVNLAYDKNNPFLATITERRQLSGPNSPKNTQHIVVDISGSGIEYVCGESLGVYVTNDEATVKELITALDFDPNALVTLPKTEDPITLHEALLKHLSIAQPTKKFLLFMQEHLADPAEQKTLEDILADKEAFDQYSHNRELIDLAEDFKSASFTPQEYIEQLRRLVPRLYSIATSPLAYPNEVHFTLDVLHYETHGRKRIGVATTYLAERAPMNEAVVPVFLAKSNFHLPEDKDTDVIMVGPGTGVAPFRGFVQERKLNKSKGRSWLFFGNPYRAEDYLYGEEWDTALEEGHLTKLDLAFSRDQDHKIYVQDKMKENAQELWEWLQNGAYFYVCGDAQRMAKDVDATLLEIAQTQGGMSEEDAKLYIKTLKKEKRYQRDVY